MDSALHAKLKNHSNRDLSRQVYRFYYSSINNEERIFSMSVFWDRMDNAEYMSVKHKSYIHQLLSVLN